MIRNTLRVWLIFQFAATILGTYFLLDGRQFWLALIPIYLITHLVAFFIIRVGRWKADQYLSAITARWPTNLKRIVDVSRYFIRSNFFFYCFSPTSQMLSRAFALCVPLSQLCAIFGVWAAISHQSWSPVAATLMFLLHMVSVGRMSWKMNFPLFLLMNAEEPNVVQNFANDYKIFGAANLLINVTFLVGSQEFGEIIAGNVLGVTMRFTSTMTSLQNRPGMSSLFLLSDVSIYESLLDIDEFSVFGRNFQEFYGPLTDNC